MSTFQTITRKGSFDSGHRVMNEKMKCFNMHGHTYLYELEFSFTQMEDIGYSIDFKEIKRVGAQWIDDKLDHGMILNPHDSAVISATNETNSKLWLMGLNGTGAYCNPTVENIAKEIFLAMMILFKEYQGLKINKVTLYETPNCYTTCTYQSISELEEKNWNKFNAYAVEQYAKEKGIVNYDDRKQD